MSSNPYNPLTLEMVFKAFIRFGTDIYGRYLWMFIIVALVETILVIMLHACMGHGLRLNWLFGSNVLTPRDKKYSGDVQVKHFYENLGLNPPKRKKKD